MKPQLRLLALFLLFSALSPFAWASGPTPRYHDAQGGFSYVPPAGWQVKEFPGLKYKVALGPRSQDFTPNINVVDEAYDGPLKDYVQANVVNLQKAFPGFHEIRQAGFQTASRLDAVKLVADIEQNGKTLHQIFYFFDDGATKYVVTCTTMAGAKPGLDAVFDGAMKTFSFDKKK